MLLLPLILLLLLLSLRVFLLTHVTPHRYLPQQRTHRRGGGGCTTPTLPSLLARARYGSGGCVRGADF